MFSYHHPCSCHHLFNSNACYLRYLGAWIAKPCLNQIKLKPYSEQYINSKWEQLIISCSKKKKKMTGKLCFYLELNPFAVSLTCLGEDPLQTDPQTSMWLRVERFFRLFPRSHVTLGSRGRILACKHLCYWVGNATKTLPPWGSLLPQDKITTFERLSSLRVRAAGKPSSSRSSTYNMFPF